MKHSIIFCGLDVHKDSITIALADGGRNGESQPAKGRYTAFVSIFM